MPSIDQQHQPKPTMQKDLQVNLDQYDTCQVELMKEMCIVINDQDQVIGFDTKQNTHLWKNITQNNLLHRAFSVFVFDKENRLLLQQRASEKITFPEYWTNTCCSHPLNLPLELEETDQVGVRHAVVRKLDHELGITSIDRQALQYLTRIQYRAQSCHVWGEHEIDYIFFTQTNGDLQFVPSVNEVMATRFVTQLELKQMILDADLGKIKLTPWFKLICEHFLFNWWDHLIAGTLHKCVDKETIHNMN